MSLASTYAAAMAAQMSALSAAQATAPPPFTGPQGMSLSVNQDGSCHLTFGQFNADAPAAVMLALSTWITATFAG